MRRGVLATLALAGSLLAVTPPPSDAGAAEPRARGAHKLWAFESCASLVRYGRRHVDKGLGGLRPDFGPYPPEPFYLPEPDTPGRGGQRLVGQQESAGTAPDSPTSTTNVQEAGVDEPDIVKVGESVAYVVGHDRVLVVDTSPDGPRVLGTLELPGYSHQLLVKGERLLVLSQSSSGWLAVIREVDVSDPANPRVLRVQAVPGYLLTARLNGDTARVVIASTPPGLYEADVRRRLDGWMPRMVLKERATHSRTTPRLTGCRSVRHAGTFSGLDMVVVLTVDLTRGLPATDTDVLMTGSEVAYASPTSLYLASERWVPEPEAGAEPPGSVTEVHKFDISEPGQTAYRASGRVPGYLLNQFSLSERNGVLRAATTNAPSWWTGGPPDRDESFVVTLHEREGALRELGRIGGLGRGERIYAVRFVDDVGFVVTFRETDPLYTVDLSEPGDPRVLGELKIPGFSDYLHPIGDDLLLGIGQDATEEGMTLGVQVSLFDVSNLRRPARIAAERLARHSYTEVSYDHHAFLWWPPERLAIFPLEADRAGAVAFRAGRASGLERVARMSHPDPEGYYAPIRRSVVVGPRLFSFSDLGVGLHDLATLGQTAFQPWPTPPPEP